MSNLSEDLHLTLQKELERAISEITAEQMREMIRKEIERAVREAVNPWVDQVVRTENLNIRSMVQKHIKAVLEY